MRGTKLMCNKLGIFKLLHIQTVPNPFSFSFLCYPVLKAFLVTPIIVGNIFKFINQIQL